MFKHKILLVNAAEVGLLKRRNDRHFSLNPHVGLSAKHSGTHGKDGSHGGTYQELRNLVNIPPFRRLGDWDQRIMTKTKKFQRGLPVLLFDLIVIN